MEPASKKEAEMSADYRILPLLKLLHISPFSGET